MIVFKTGKRRWENKHETFVEQIKELYQIGNESSLDALSGYNDTTKGIQKLIAEAVSTNAPLRPLGAAWSWTSIATAKDGLMVDTKSLNTLFNITGQSVSPNYKGDVGKLFLAQCGNGVWELSKDLRQRKLSLKTTGASNGQTIVGAMSTGAHGSAFNFGAVQDYVVGMHIIVGANRHIWLERKSSPVVSNSFVQLLKTELVQDDDLFDSALVSMGCFGIIHGVMVETEDLFLLEAHMQKIPYDASLKKLMETLDFSAANLLPGGTERPYHFAVALNPYELNKGAHVTTMYKRPYREDYKRPVSNAQGIGPGDDAPCFIGKITQVIPALVPTIVTKLLAGALTPYSAQFGTLGEIFNNTSLHGRLLSAAIGVPIAQVGRVTDLIIATNKTAGPFPGLIAYRFVKKSKAKLAFTRFDPTCVIELDGAFSGLTHKLFLEVWKRLDQEKIPYTFHWGKVNELTPERVSRMYGRDLDTWIASRNKLLDNESRKVFTSPITRQWGLEKV